MARQRKYPDELLDRRARMVFDSGRPIAHVANDLGIHHETLRKWVRRTEADEGKRKDLLSSEERQDPAGLSPRRLPDRAGDQLPGPRQADPATLAPQGW